MIDIQLKPFLKKCRGIVIAVVLSWIVALIVASSISVFIGGSGFIPVTFGFLFLVFFVYTFPVVIGIVFLIFLFKEIKLFKVYLFLKKRLVLSVLSVYFTLLSIVFWYVYSL